MGSVGPLTKHKDDPTFEPTQQDIETFARCIFPMVKTYFESEEGQREFAEWKRKKELGLIPKDAEF